MISVHHALALFNLKERGFCWSIGRGRMGHECRIWPTASDMRRPVIIEVGGDTLDEIVANALRRLGNQVPQPMEEKYVRTI
jgi:hypothetical protein